MNELISIIVPVYNVEPYLARCVESLLRQTHEHLEIILVDDGSTDGCPRICDHYAEKDLRIQVIHKGNGGLSDARNAGLKIAQGNFIGFVDSDDWIADDMYSTLLNCLQKHGADVAECGYVIAEGGHNPDEVKGDGGELVFSAEDALKELLLERSLKTVVWNKLYRKSVLEGEFFPFGKYSEDVFWTYRVLGRSRAVVCTEKSMYFYFQRAGSIMDDSFNVRRLDALEGQQERLSYIKNRFPMLSSLAEFRFFLFSLYNYACLIDCSDCDPAGQHRRQIRDWVLKNSIRLLKNPNIGKYRILVMAFCIHPGMACRIRKRVQGRLVA